jgi:hypothetical protein
MIIRFVQCPGCHLSRTIPAHMYERGGRIIFITADRMGVYIWRSAWLADEGELVRPVGLQPTADRISQLAPRALEA